MSKNPFSLYDFLGYAFPGAISIILFWFILRVSPNSIYDLLNNNDNLFSLFKPNNLILLILASYVAGHLFAYLSSLIVERFSLWNYDYPSSYLMAKEPPKSNLFNFKNLETVKIFWRIIFCFVLFPISICSFLFGKCLRINSYVIRPMDETTQKHLKEKYPRLLETLNLSDSDEETLNNNYDYHRIIYHYEYEKQSKHSKKMDNYVALYGFLRSLALIFTLFFDCLLIKGILSVNWRMPIDWEMIIFITICGLIAYTFYLGFIKFYRRFTLESFMALITDPEIKSPKYEHSHHWH